jgi:hypothetical protein
MCMRRASSSNSSSSKGTYNRAAAELNDLWLLKVDLSRHLLHRRHARGGLRHDCGARRGQGRRRRESERACVCVCVCGGGATGRMMGVSCTTKGGDQGRAGGWVPVAASGVQPTPTHHTTDHHGVTHKHTAVLQKK